MRPLHVAAIVAAVLVAGTAVDALRRPAPRPDLTGRRTKPTKVAYVPCTIQRATFGGAEAAVLKIRKDRKVRYVVLDLPSEDDPLHYHPFMHYQGRWLTQAYGDIPLSALVGVIPPSRKPSSRLAVSARAIRGRRYRVAGSPSELTPRPTSGINVTLAQKRAARGRLFKLTGRRQTERTGHSMPVIRPQD
jgi:hypothetical protein